MVEDNEQKKQFRRDALAVRRAMTPEARKEQSLKITETLLASDAFRAAKSVFCYVSVMDEVHTEDILEAVLDAGKELYVPFITDRENSGMEAARVDTMGDLVPGEYGILTADAGDGVIPEFEEPENINLIIVPGAAFDRNGGRLGLGGGFYDKFLARATKSRFVAIAYSCQIYDEVPCGRQDIPVHAIITDQGVIEID